MCEDWIRETYVNDLRHAANKHYLAIKSAREILEQWSQDIASTTEQDYYNQILKALGGKTNEA